MRREDLIVVLGRQIALAVISQSLLRAHHDRIGEAADQHHAGKNAVHHADALVIDGRDPLLPEIGPVAFERYPDQDADDHNDHQPRRRKRNRLINGDCGPAQFAKHQPPPFEAGERLWPPGFSSGPGAAGAVSPTTASKRCGSTAR